ncbi:MAG: hypothetical protein NVSMB31_05130 [Vulcanimicrobiaceae bacterium]
MNIRILIGALFIGFIPLAASASTQPDPSADKLAVQAQLLASAAAFENHDLAALARTYVNDASLTIFEGGEVNTGWVDYRDNHITPELAEIVAVHYTLSAIDTHVEGNTAWATFNYHIVGSTAKRSFDSFGIGTAILQKNDGTWRIVHWHSTKSPKRPAGS